MRPTVGLSKEGRWPWAATVDSSQTSRAAGLSIPNQTTASKPTSTTTGRLDWPASSNPTTPAADVLRGRLASTHNTLNTVSSGRPRAHVVYSCIAMHELLGRFQRLKMAFVSLLLVVLGGSLIALGNHIGDWRVSPWLRAVPWNEFGGILVGAGLLSIWIDHVFQRERDQADDLRLRAILHDQAPVMRDAVLDAFAANHEDLRRVATPELLDQLITNALGLRLHDERFAAEVYADIRDQAIAATERWHDANVTIDLAPAALRAPGSSPGGRTTSQRLADYFTVTVRWEYTVIPTHAQRRFACVSDRSEYAELATERGNTSSWFIRPDQGIDASSRDAFELLRFTVDGDDRPIRRSERKTGQSYAVHIDDELIRAGRPVTVSYTYRTITSRAGHLLFFDIEQPTKELSIVLNYDGCGIARVSALDLIPSVRPTRIERTPPTIANKSIRVEIDGWIFPRSGAAFVWTLESETRDPGQHRKSPTLTSRA